jgi:hypothetical protein
MDHRSIIMLVANRIVDTLKGRRNWTDEEIEKLRDLYISQSQFDEITKALPQRSSNAIRQKASRLGFKRPEVISKFIDSQMLIKCTENGDDEVHLVKCSECDNWIKVTFASIDTNTIRCPHCNSVCKYIS